MFTHMQTYWIYSGNMEKHPQWTGHFMIIHTEYFTFNILTLQEHTLCIECKLARHSSRIVKYAIMLFATFRSLNTLRGIIAYRPHITGPSSVSTLSFPILSFRLWWLTYSAGFSTWAKIPQKCLELIGRTYFRSIPLEPPDVHGQKSGAAVKELL